MDATKEPMSVESDIVELPISLFASHGRRVTTHASVGKGIVMWQSLVKTAIEAHEWLGSVFG